MLIIAAAHKCEPVTESTYYLREYTPILIYGDAVKQGGILESENSFKNYLRRMVTLQADTGFVSAGFLNPSPVDPS